eukprot:gene32939-39836_t
MSGIQVTDARQIFLVSNADPDVGTCLNGTMKSHLRYTIPDLLRRDLNSTHMTMRILHCEIPHSIYTVNSSNNQLNLLVGGVTHTIAIPQGNYNGSTLVAFLQGWFDGNLASLGMQVTLATSTGKVKLSATSAFSVLSSSTCQRILGLGETLASSLVAGRQEAQMPFPLDCSGIKAIHIRALNMAFASYNTLDKVGDILKSIPVLVPPYGIIVWSNQMGQDSLVRSLSQSNTLEILLTDAQTGLPIDMNGLDWVICLEVRRHTNVYPRFALGESFDLPPPATAETAADEDE